MRWKEVSEKKVVEFETFLKEVGHGDVKVTVVDGKLFVVPRQIIERPGKAGVRVQIVVDEPIQLKNINPK